MSAPKLRSSVAKLLASAPPELRAWAEANPAEANARYKALSRRAGGLLARHGERGAPAPGERGYVAPEPACAEYDPAAIADSTLKTALAYMEEPELSAAFEAAEMELDCPWSAPTDDDDPDDTFSLEEILAIPWSDCDGKPWRRARRQQIALDVVRLVLETMPDRTSMTTLVLGDYAHGGTRAEPAGEHFAIPWWAALALATDLFAGKRKDRLVNVSKEEARAFAAQHHSHLPRLNFRGVLYVLGIRRGERLVAIATANTPTGRWDRGSIDPDNVLEVTRIATDGTTRNATSRILARLIDLLPASRRNNTPGPDLLVTYTLVGEPAAPYRALREKGLRPVSFVRGKEQAGGSARQAGNESLGDVPKIRWEAGSGAGPARWDLLERVVDAAVSSR